MEWIKTEHSLPDEGKRILVYDGENIYESFYKNDLYVDMDKSVHSFGLIGHSGITHWLEIKIPTT